MTQTTEKTCLKCGAKFVPGRYQRRMLYCGPSCRKTNAEKCRDRYQRNPKPYNEAMRAYYAANRDRIRQEMKERWHQTRRTSPWRHIMGGAKHRAKVGKFEFDLTDEWARERWTGRCEMTDIEFQLGLGSHDMRMFSPSIDRIEPSIGYTQANCRFVLFAVNCMKQDGTDSDVVRMAEALIKKLRQSCQSE